MRFLSHKAMARNCLSRRLRGDQQGKLEQTTPTSIGIDEGAALPGLR